MAEHTAHTPALTSAPEPALRVRGLVPGYGGRGLLPPLDFAVGTGEFWAIAGRNGSGKSTLLRTLLGLQPAVSGAHRWRPGLAIGYVPQRSETGLAVPARVIDIVLGGADTGWSFMRPRLTQTQREHAARAMADTQIESLARRPVQHLSEGQKQRVWMARALAQNPGILILDEPTSAMDLVAERTIFELVDGLRTARGISVLVVSHHLPLLTSLATHLVLLDKDEGLAVAGALEDVAKTPAFRARFGVTPPGQGIDWRAAANEE